MPRHKIYHIILRGQLLYEVIERVKKRPSKKKSRTKLETLVRLARGLPRNLLVLCGVKNGMARLMLLEYALIVTRYR